MEMFHLRIFKYRNAYASEKDVRWNQPTYKRYDQCLVTWKFSSCTSSPAGFLTYRSSHKTAFPKLHDSLSNCPSSSVTALSRMVLYSLLTVTSSYRSCTCFPFTCCPPVLMNFFTAAAAPDASSIVMGDILTSW